MQAEAVNLFDLDLRKSFRIGLSRPQNIYRDLKLDINRPPSFIKNLFFRTADFVKASHRKPALETLLPPPSPTSGKGLKAVKGLVAGFKKLASFIAATPANGGGPSRSGDPTEQEKRRYELGL